MSQSQVPSSQDSFTSELELATFEQLVEGVSWRILDLQKSADNIRHTAYSYRDSYPSSLPQTCCCRFAGHTVKNGDRGTIYASAILDQQFKN